MTGGDDVLQSAAVQGASFSAAVGLILRTGLIAGTLDIGENLIYNAFRGITPPMVFRFIASGLIGRKAAISLGLASVAIGGVLHYFIATSWTAIFYAFSRRFKILVRRPIIIGLLYGALVYVVMNFVVLPLSRVPPRPSAMTITARVNAVMALLFCIGLPISLLIARSERRRPG